jgi:hypothetical protein
MLLREGWRGEGRAHACVRVSAGEEEAAASYM